MTGPAAGPLETLAPPDRRWHYRRSLASRVTLLTTMAVGLTVAFVAAGAYVTVRVQLGSTLDESLLDRAHQTAESPTIQNRDTGEEVPLWALGAADVRIGFMTAEGKYSILDKKATLPLGSPELAVALGKKSSQLRTMEAGGVRYRVATVPTPDEGVALVVAQSLEPQQRVLTKLGIVMLLFGLAGMIAAGLAGWGVARSGLRPVRRITDKVEDIARTEDFTPLPVEGVDEIARLATAFNQMLLTLESSRERQRRLVADAGHELRTPLTALRTNIELLTQAAQGEPGMMGPEARDELLSDVRAQIEELSTLVGDLVELARDDEMTHVVAEVELHEALEAAVARVRRRAPGVTIELDNGSWFVVGESGAIERALTNLLDNAAKWSPPGGTVRVTLDTGVVTVDDEGPGISDVDLPRVFDRFYRSEESRTMPGSGLGLSIVQQVVDRHAGTVTAGRSPSGGARMQLWLPGTATRTAGVRA